jgi:hypothetical protein
MEERLIQAQAMAARIACARVTMLYMWRLALPSGKATAGEAVK